MTEWDTSRSRPLQGGPEQPPPGWGRQSASRFALSYRLPSSVDHQGEIREAACTVGPQPSAGDTFPLRATLVSLCCCRSLLPLLLACYECLWLSRPSSCGCPSLARSW